LNTINLRKEAHLTGQNSKSPFIRALDQLQRDFRILPTAIADVGAWHYAFKYDLTHRVYPDLIEEARPISESQARRNLVLAHLRSLGVTRERDITSLFHWEPAVTHRTVESLKRQVRSFQKYFWKTRRTPGLALWKLSIKWKVAGSITDQISQIEEECYGISHFQAGSRKVRS